MAKSAWRQNFEGKIVNRLDEVVLRAGEDVITRRQLVVDGDSANFQVAVNLNEVLWGYRPRNLREVSRRVDQHMLRKHENIGDTAIFVMMCALESVGVDQDAWADLDLTEKRRRKRKRKVRH